MLTVESEYVNATHIAKKIIWLHFLIIQIFKSILPSTNIFSDSKFDIALQKTTNTMHIQRILIFNIILFTGSLRKTRFGLYILPLKI